MEYSEPLYGIWLSLRYVPGDPTPGRLLSRLRTPSSVYRAKKELLYSLGFSSAEVRPLSAKSLERAQSIAQKCAGSGIEVITYADDRYPVQFFQLDSPPAVIYCKGKLPAPDEELFISVVGTRRMSDVGRLNAHRLCFDLASAGAVVVSGMARGIDSVCHEGALDGGGRTVAVLGCGCDVVYPPENGYLYGKIIENGAVISEYPPGEEPLADHFPVRNRLIAALGAATVVAEAGVGSGALITADRASALGRTVYAIPGPISSPSAKGSNLLLKRGAALCTGAEDIISGYELIYPSKIKADRISAKKYFIGNYNTSPDGGGTEQAVQAAGFDTQNVKISRAGELDGDDRRIYEELLKRGPMSAEELSAAGIDIGKAVYRLTLLEIGGLVVSLPGGKYAVK
ncbi:MAG: DNA-processing protein DprA [Clostridia bacterium]|nr:DNA-processing protein DprA [Clostridia bacterium]